MVHLHLRPPLSARLLLFLPLALTMYMPRKKTNQLLPSHRHRNVTALVSKAMTARRKEPVVASPAMAERMAVALLCGVLGWGGCDVKRCARRMGNETPLKVSQLLQYKKPGVGFGAARFLFNSLFLFLGGGSRESSLAA